MASGSFNSSTGVNLNLYCEWSSTTNAVGNYSTVTMQTYLKSYSLYVGARSDSYVKCNGENYTYTAPAISKNSSTLINTILLSSKTFTVYHNSNGDKSITLEAGWRFSGTYSGQSISWITCSQTVNLDHIPRAARITSASTFFSNQTPTLTFSNPGGFSLNARLEFGGTSIQRNNIPNTGSYSFSLSLEEKNLLFSKCPNSTTLTVRYIIATKIGSSSETHWSWLDRTMIVESGNPTLGSFTASLINNTVPSGWGIYVQGKSQCALQISNCSGIYASTITSFSIKQGLAVLASSPMVTTPVLMNSGTITYTATITDSRGRTASKTVSITVHPYSSPSITSVVSQRCLQNGTLNDDGTYIRCVASTAFSSCNSMNTATRKVYFRQQDTDEWSSGIVFSNGVAVVIGNAAINVDLPYQVMYEIIDAFNTVQMIDRVSTAYTTMDFKKGGKGISIGKVAEFDNLFDVAMQSKFRNGLILVDSNGTEYDVLSIIKNL